jgi:hypothetical protein
VGRTSASSLRFRLATGRRVAAVAALVSVRSRHGRRWPREWAGVAAVARRGGDDRLGLGNSFGGLRRADLVGCCREGLWVGRSGLNTCSRAWSDGCANGIVARGCVRWVELRLEPTVVRADVVQLAQCSGTPYQGQHCEVLAATACVRKAYGHVVCEEQRATVPVPSTYECFQPHVQGTRLQL